MNDGRSRGWTEVADPGLQPERTALAWERTAIATMVAGTLLARVATDATLWPFAALGLAFVAAGGLTLVWAGRHYADLHGPITEQTDVIHPRATRLAGRITISLTIVATALALLILVQG